MFTELSSYLITDRHRRLEQHAAAVRSARARTRVRSTVGNRAASLRQDLGFRLVEAGLRVAVGRANSDLAPTRPRR